MFRVTFGGFRFALAILAASSLTAAGRSTAETTEPTKLAGTWVWTWKDRIGETHKHILEVEGVGTELAARELFDDQPSVKVGNLTYDGASVRFTVVRDKRTAQYIGKVVDSDHIDGRVTVTSDGQSEEFGWKAERRKALPE